MNHEELLKKLIKYQTVYTNSQKEFKSCFNFIKEYLKTNKQLQITEYNFHNNISLFIKNTSSKKLDILFLGHIDVVEGMQDQFHPKKIKNRLYGRGAFDMKGHDAVMINIMKSLNTSKKVGLILTSDEERGGFYGIPKIIEKTPFKADLVIVPDGGNDFTMITEEKGVLQLEITVKGKASHASKPYEGENAIEKLIKIYQKITEIYPNPKSKSQYQTSVNLGLIEGGNTVNIVPDQASMQLDFRYTSHDSKENIIHNIQKLDSDITIKVLAEGDSYEANLENIHVKKYLQICEKILERKIKQIPCESASDARFFKKYHMNAIIMNAKGNNMHGKKEYIEIDSLYQLERIYKEIIK